MKRKQTGIEEKLYTKGSLEGPHKEAEIQRKASRRGKNFTRASPG